MDREEAFEELKLRTQNNDLILHSIAVEAIMREFANYYKEDVENWGLAGLLHDIDYEKTINQPEKHGLIGAEILEDMGLDDEIVYAIKAHNDYNKIERHRKIDKVLYSCDSASRLILECVLLIPTKKIEELKLEHVMKKMNDKKFAESISREKILKCEELNMKVEEFLHICLNAMKKKKCLILITKTNNI